MFTLKTKQNQIVILGLVLIEYFGNKWYDSNF